MVVINSDQINLYKIKFTVKCLFAAITQAWRIGTPSFLSHDCHRPIAWSKPLCLYLEPGLTRLTGIINFPETHDEIVQLESNVKAYIKQSVGYKTIEFANEFDNFKKQYLKDGESYELCCQNSLVIKQKGLVKRIFPQLFAEADKDGLLPYKNLEEFLPGIFSLGEYVIFAHTYFRRSLSHLNTLNGTFFEFLSSLKDETSFDNLRIAFDVVMFDRLAISSLGTDILSVLPSSS